MKRRAEDDPYTDEQVPEFKKSRLEPHYWSPEEEAYLMNQMIEHGDNPATLGPIMTTHYGEDTFPLRPSVQRVRTKLSGGKVKDWWEETGMNFYLIFSFCCHIFS